MTHQSNKRHKGKHVCEEENDSAQEEGYYYDEVEYRAQDLEDAIRTKEVELS